MLIEKHSNRTGTKYLKTNLTCGNTIAKSVVNFQSKKVRSVLGVAQKKVKVTKKKKKTLIPEPNWDKLCRSKSEDQMISAWHECEAFVHGEIPERDQIHSMKKWVRLNWDLGEKVNQLPDVFLLCFAKNGWKAIRLGFIPASVRENLEKNLLPLYRKADDLREKMFYEPTIHPSMDTVDEDNPFHPDKVKKWLVEWKRWLSSNSKLEESNDSQDRLSYQTAKTYVSNMNMYLKSGVWLDNRYGENREFKNIPICTSLAYDKNGIVKRNKGTFYPDLGIVWME